MTRRAALVRPLLLAFVLVFGFGLVYSVLILGGLSIMDSAVRARQPTFGVMVTSDGAPYLYEYSSDFTERRVLNLDGDEIRGMKPQQTLREGTLAGPKEYQRVRTPDWNRQIASLNDLGSPPTYWYLVQQGDADEYGYVVGFDSQSKLQVGYIGVHGFRADEPPIEERFPMLRGAMGGMASNVSSYGPREPRISSIMHFPDEAGDVSAREFYFISGQRVVGVHVGDRAVRTLLEVPDLISADFVVPATPSPADKTQPPKRPKTRLVVRRTDRVTLVSAGGDVLGEYRLPEELRAVIFRFYELLDDTALAIVWTYTTDDILIDFCWFNRAGEVTRRHRVTSAANPWIAEWPKLGGWLRAAACPAPVVAILAVPAPETSRYRLPMREAIRAALAATWPPLTCMFILAAVLALQTYRRNRRLGQPWSWAWGIFVFVFGLPGLVGYLLHRRWPAQAPCPACRATVPHDRLFCIACGETFPQPEPKDTQVISP